MMDSTGNVEAQTAGDSLSGNEINKTYDESESMELSNTQNIELIAEDLALNGQDLFEINGEWKSSIQESINETVTKIKSKEDDIQLKYEKVLEMRNSLLEKEKALKSRIEVITEILKNSRL